MNPMMKRLLLEPQGIVKRGLVAWYDFTDLAGSQVLTDKSGCGNHGQNGSTAGADTNDVVFDGTKAVFGGDDYVILPSLNVFAYGLIAFRNPSLINKDTGKIGIFSITGDKGILFGSATGSLTNEIITIGDYGSLARSGWCSATDGIIAGNHILEYWWDGIKYCMSLDAKELPITVAGIPDLLTTGGANSFSNVNGSFSDGFSFYAGVFNRFSLNSTERKQNQKYIKKILSQKGVFI